MRENTALLYSKYDYFFNLLFDDRDDLFTKTDFFRNKPNGTTLTFSIFDVDHFFETREHILEFHKEMKIFWRCYTLKTYQIIKKFDEGKKNIKIKYYRNILMNTNLCLDVINIIISYIYINGY